MLFENNCRPGHIPSSRYRQLSTSYYYHQTTTGHRRRISLRKESHYRSSGKSPETWLMLGTVPTIGSSPMISRQTLRRTPSFNWQQQRSSTTTTWQTKRRQVCDWKQSAGT
ncbi:hypothetical protein L5515_010732 [Caenorhabditis briggsae]|uniref:Uncharacterized protein n=1 Tax=Caenorhabditis briggsae TaxID=6238 RepID=A0AAE9ESY5_CAEBR|nr:hypothetical protein L5515_010732 [Caenorhabditis briggsae]